MTKPVPVEDSSFEQIVLQAKEPVLVDLWAPWCGPCLMIAPILEELAEEYSGRINFVKMNVDLNPKTATKYRIMSIPTLLIFKNGKPASQIIGFRPKTELKKSLNAVLD